MGLIKTFIEGLGNFAIVAIIGFIIVIAILWILGRSAYKA